MAAILLVGCGSGRRSSAARDGALQTDASSPSGRFVLEVSSNAGSVSFRVSEFGRVVLDEPFRSPDRFVNFIGWADSIDEVWFYSSDSGTFIWKFDGTAWVKRGFRSEPAPEFLRRLRPKWFPN